MEAQVDAYLDGELTAGDAVELEAHLAECSSCRRFRADRLALRSAIAAEMPRLAAPDAVRARVRTAWRAEAAAGRPRRSVTLLAPTTWRWLALAASLAVVAVGGWRLGSARTASAILADEGAGEPRPLAHARPPERRGVLRPAHREAWFAGKLDFSPPVHDFAGRGYPLLGGRLDYLNGRPVAALVYGRRQHFISVFLWPADGPARPAAPLERRGYHVLHWASPDFAYWVTSDVGLAEPKGVRRDAAAGGLDGRGRRVGAVGSPAPVRGSRTPRERW